MLTVEQNDGIFLQYSIRKGSVCFKIISPFFKHSGFYDERYFQGLAMIPHEVSFPKAAPLYVSTPQNSVSPHTSICHPPPGLAS